ncbi:MAG: phytanoyl-CoA dioxygenase family protein [Acidimicrobiaceae bacterium]|nr:phytanoyl-CoA dioxygenase family protein [Acidimicrobiaceae bacterium]MXW76811.1 phytanoyl-CoA dioxygenase family protein [Acidimicrobiaceae bacterium]MYC41837.1 phytanoyl-CoA dioxygenase family protein [Acidimicrobiaceae bacterium]MYI57135.1 phytanoyl-CoA dioxygenase family protein [Acidimicrobiaceae bacterium]
MLTTDDLRTFDADGFVEIGLVLDSNLIERLHERFERLFAGEFETGTAPDEVNWQLGESDPSLTRQICNAWKADRLIAATVLDERLGAAVARLARWPGARIVQDNVIWKPPGAKSLGFHRDNAYLAWYTPSEMCSCWIALDDTSASGGTLELARGSHRWPTSAGPQGEFHAPDDYRATVAAAAASAGTELDIAALEMSAGSAAFHHGWAWHGSGPNRSGSHRRALVLHCASSEARFCRAGFGAGNGPVYTRYARLCDDQMDENHFPILWHRDGYRTPGI